MRSMIVMAMFAASLANAAWNDYEEVRELELGTRGIDTVSIEAGAGSMEVIGVSGSSEINVTATIQVPEGNDDKARKIIESDLVLILEKQSDTAVLKAYFEDRMFSFGDSPSVRLEVRMPEGMHLVVDDGSGSMQIENVRGDIVIDDGSGSLAMEGVGGTVEIDDGSGSITVREVGGDLSINDGSGSIKVRGVAGSVTVDDGSGSIDVSDIEADLIIVDDGSGGLSFSNITGKVEDNS